MSANAGIPQVSAVPLTGADIQNMRNDLMALARAVVALQQRVAEAEVNTTEVRPQLAALKVHSESLPQALRELRRSETAMKQRLDALECRLRAIEGRTNLAPVNA